MNIKDTAEQFALAQWLSDWPSDMTYDQILDAIRRDDYDSDEIIIWQLIEDETAYQVVELIENTAWAFERTAQKLLEEHDAILHG